jgi:hypothetical protein
MVGAGSVAHVPPFSWVEDFRDDLKWSWEGRVGGASCGDCDSAVQGAGGGSDCESGEAHGTAAGSTGESAQRGGKGWGMKTLAQACNEVGVSTEVGLERLRAQGINAEPLQTMREIADANQHGRPGELVSLIQPGAGH